MAKIAHIFNEHKANDNNEFITSQEFEIDYIKDYNRSYKYKKSGNLITDFEKKYYESLEPIENNPIISKYDDEKIDKLVEELGDNILMISGDFWGIQKFIFDGLTSSKASKILRSRSAMVQLITYVVADMIKKSFNGSEEVLFGAGKFLILAKKEDNYKSKIEEIQKKLDDYFLKNFFGQNGFILSYAETTKENILSQDSGKMKSDLEKLAKDNELKKLKKFNFKELSKDEVVFNIFANSDDKICKFCSKRARKNSKEACDICDAQIKLGEKLTKNYYIEINRYSNGIKIFDDYFVNFLNSDKLGSASGDVFDISSEKYDGSTPKWSLNSYVPKNSGKIKTFEEIGKGSSGLMALKADVDKLGDTFRDYYMNSFKKFNRLSRELDFFFSDYATNLIEEEFSNCYVVFAGGDDLFLIGEYKEIISFAKRLREEFYRFSLQKATLSMGLVMFKPSTPISYISRIADEAEARAKAVKKDDKDRNGIDIFGISMKFDEFIEIEKEFKKIVDYLESNADKTTTFLYRLIEICDMKNNLDKGVSGENNYKEYEFNPADAMWKSKLNYLIRRNIKANNNDFDIFKVLFELIEKYGEKLKVSIFLKIYNDRDNKK